MRRTKLVPVVKSIMKNFLRRLIRFQAQKKLRQLRSFSVPALDKIANAIDDALNDNLTSEEKVWVDQIEELRSVLSADITGITMTDYGAGSPKSNRTKEEMYAGVATPTSISECCRASKPYFWALVLFKLIRELKPTTSIELGTCLGISAAYQASAHKINDKGSITTLEGETSLASLSKKNMQKLGLDNTTVVCGRFQDNLERVLKENKPIDYAFVDGHHDEEATITYFESFVPYLSSRAIIVLDDISWSNGMRRAWDRIMKDENVKFSVDLGGIGICLLDSDMEKIPGFRIKVI
jgi:precorrin-6B methylase 2